MKFRTWWLRDLEVEQVSYVRRELKEELNKWRKLNLERKAQNVSMLKDTPNCAL